MVSQIIVVDGQYKSTILYWLCKIKSRNNKRKLKTGWDSILKTKKREKRENKSSNS